MVLPRGSLRSPSPRSGRFRNVRWHLSKSKSVLHKDEAWTTLTFGHCDRSQISQGYLSEMAVTAFPTAESSPELTLLNVARLFTRLEYNLLNPGSEVRTLHKSELQRLRVSKKGRAWGKCRGPGSFGSPPLQNVEYARNLLSQLERSIPQIKSSDRRHEAQSEIARDRQLLKRMQIILDEEESRTREHTDDSDDEDDQQYTGTTDDEWKDLFEKPAAAQLTDRHTSEADALNDAATAEDSGNARTKTIPPNMETSGSDRVPTTVSTTTTTTTTTNPSTSTPVPPSTTLRKRNTHPNHPSAPTSTPSTAISTSTNVHQHQHQPSPDPNLSSKEDALSAARLEQEDLTGSLLSLASQLKASSQSFQATLENEKSVLDRAVSGMDKTSSTMEAAGQRMGMLRRMTEGKGWWGRMMLYAWIFGLWVVAILIVYVGPKLRF
ncbi:hypothetical protein N7539_002430 [Penicillium diatomitis]|uniref:Synaptobrevin n=1 Tax=Penicillium diatomitis TaxID=2819901 RepID=A0A9W9XF97_9EURO|nr:uncharacterized protein N7539_002430 [Penicillium diatomitis]KAJ5490863.1 hypothetical protein N7539_002430 [Penicillium diatomitis]